MGSWGGSIGGGSGSGSSDWLDAVANQAALPGTATAGQRVIVLDNGDGKAAGYVYSGSAWTQITDEDWNLTTHTSNTSAHHSKYLDTEAAAQVTYENLDSNGDIGSGASQIPPPGNHAHAHNDTTSPQGGTSNEYYHLNAVDYGTRKTFLYKTGINLKSTGNNTLSSGLGDGSGSFVPERLVLVVTDASSLTGDAEIKLGTTAGDDDLIISTSLNNFKTVGQQYHFLLSGLFPSISCDISTITLNITSADTGTSGVISAYLEGHYI